MLEVSRIVAATLMVSDRLVLTVQVQMSFVVVAES
jgi:hypothetical protein